MIRWPLSFVLVGAVAAGVAYDQVSQPTSVVEASVVESNAVVTPAMTDPPSLNRAWYCPMGSSDAGGFADHEVVVVNLAPTPAVANITVLTSEGQGAGRRVELGPLATVSVPLSDSQQAEVAGAVVEIISGDGAVAHRLTTSSGTTEGPCATSVSNNWYFAGGRTEVDSTQYLALMNPFPETAVFNVEFRTLARSRQPLPLQGAFVPPRSVRVINVGDHITNESSVATIVTAQRGRLVAERLQVLDGQLGVEGAAVQLGVPTPATGWVLPAGRVHEEGEDILTIFNPAESAEPTLQVDPETGEEVFVSDQSDATAVVRIEMWPNNPDDIALYGVVTATREVRPGNFEIIDVAAQAQRFGFPLPYELGVNVSVDNQLPVVVERWKTATDLLDRTSAALETAAEEAEESADGEEGEGEESTSADGESAEGESAEGEEAPDGENAATDDATDPSGQPIPVLGLDAEPIPQPIPNVGISTTRGVERLSTRWVVPWVAINSDSTTVAIVSDQAAEVEIRLIAGGTELGPLTASVPADGRAVVPLIFDGLSGAAVEIVSDVPVAVETSTIVRGEGMNIVPAVPVLAEVR